ncbi:MAG: LptF/LptG family permease [Armatimonadetes bacterium]|nr:LptF/LptG family permease [Armatimonadota bacterium]
MKLVYRQVAAELVGPFVFGATAFTSVFFAGSYLLKLTGWLMSGSIGLAMAAQIVLLLLPQILVFTLPMSTLLAVLLGVGRLSGDSEIVALFASGVSLYRLAVPVIALGALVSIGSIVVNEFVVPLAFERYQSIEAAIVRAESPSGRPFTVSDEATNSDVIVKGGMDVDRGVLRNVTIIQFSKTDGAVGEIRINKDQPLLIVYASRAVWGGVKDDSKRYKWKLYDGYSQQVGTNTPAMSAFRALQTRDIEIGKTPAQFSLYQKSKLRNADQLSFRELTQIVKYLYANPDRPQEEIRRLDVSRWNKLAFPFSALIFALIAAPLGIRPQRTASSVGFGLSILLILIYWIIWHYTSQLAIQGNMAPFVGAFTADVLGIVAAVVLLRRAST